MLFGMLKQLEGDDAIIVPMAMEYLTSKPTEQLDEQSVGALLKIGEFLMHPSPDTKAAAVAAADQYFRSFVPDGYQDTASFGMQPVGGGGGGGVSVRCDQCGHSDCSVKRACDDNPLDAYGDGLLHCEWCGEPLNAFGQCMNIYCDEYVSGCETHHRSLISGGCVFVSSEDGE